MNLNGTWKDSGLQTFLGVEKGRCVSSTPWCQNTPTPKQLLLHLWTKPTHFPFMHTLNSHGTGEAIPSLAPRL